MIVLHTGEVPDEPGDGVGLGGGRRVEVVGTQAVEGGVDFFPDAAVTVDEDVLCMHSSTIAHRPLNRPRIPAGPSVPAPPDWWSRPSGGGRPSRTPSRRCP